MMSRFIPASAKKPFWMPIYQGQPTALAEPIIPVEMVSAALTFGAANKASAQQSAAMHCVSRDEAMAVPPEFLSALLASRFALPCRFLQLATMRREGPNHSRSRRAARHQKVAGEHLHHFVVLIERRVLHPDHAAIGLRFRGPYFEHLAGDAKLVARPHRERPAQLVEADAQNAAGRPELAVDQKPHGDRCGVPATGRQSLERRLQRRRFVEMVELRIELLGEGDDLFLADALAAGQINLSHSVIFQILLLHRATCSRVNHTPPATAAALIRPKVASATDSARKTAVRSPVQRSAK